MDNAQLLHYLSDHSLEEGRTYIQCHLHELADYDAFAGLMADQALRLRDAEPLLSLKLAELLTFLGEVARHPLSHALGLKAQGDALDYMGQFQAALACLDMAGEEFLKLGDAVNWARTRVAWIISCAWLGRTTEALQEAARARDVLLKHGEKYWACVIDHNTAVIYSQIGQYHKALELYERILAIFPMVTGEDESVIKRAVALADMNRARNLGWLGDFEQAYRLLLQAQDAFIASGQTGQILNTEFSMAELDYVQGYYGSALRRYYQIHDSMVQQHFDVPEAQASIMLRMASCLVKLNRAEEACRLADEAVAIYRQLGISLLLADALREYAAILLASHRRREAFAALERASELFSQAGFAHHASAAQLQQTELLSQSGDWKMAYEQARKVKKYFEAQGLVSRAVRAGLLMAEALIEQTADISLRDEEQSRADLNEAAALCAYAASLARQHNLLEESYKSQYLAGRLAVMRGDLSRAIECYETAIDQIECILDDLVYDLSPSFLHTTWMVYEDMIALSLRQGQIETAFCYLERARSMALRQYLNRSKGTSRQRKQQESAAVLRIRGELDRWQEKYHQYSAQLATLDHASSSSVNRAVLQSELKRCETHLSELFERLHLYESGMRSMPYLSTPSPSMKTEQLDIAQLRQPLASDHLLLSYFLSKETLVIFAVNADKVVVHEHPEGVRQLERLFPLLHAHLEPGGWPDAQKPPQAPIRHLLQKLYQLLIAPVSALLPSSGSLTIVPYGPLHKLPFHALYDGSRFLIEHYQINYLPASSLLLPLDAQKRNLPANTKPPLFMGYSDGGHMKSVLDEARTLASLLEGRCYLEDDATIARLMKEAGGSPLIHLATHGKSSLESPHFSYIRLADGQLNAIDAFNLELEGCELVTLSGCETGLALSGGGDEQLGLGRAFLAAGASSLLMSLWPVEDDSTSELMQCFYQHLLKGDTKVQALRAAQCSFLQSAKPAYAHPYFWAAFRLVGETGSLRFNEANAHTSTSETELLKM
ncbi:MAG TPA: CHAT domain-containing tetratricopeptide repeat protein [Ktedonobacteraceae bacterium]|nr:CHAT domain-containing tetratricopeptide repeat protein [Ktedonobacteraceae bacterium]